MSQHTYECMNIIQPSPWGCLKRYGARMRCCWIQATLAQNKGRYTRTQIHVKIKKYYSQLAKKKSHKILSISKSIHFVPVFIYLYIIYYYIYVVSRNATRYGKVLQDYCVVFWNENNAIMMTISSIFPTFDNRFPWHLPVVKLTSKSPPTFLHRLLFSPLWL
jgi:hypothetical protein